MEGISKIIKNTRVPVFIKAYTYLNDHRFEGRAVLPAVEVMQLLSGSVSREIEGINAGNIFNAEFLRFLPIDEGIETIKAFNEITEDENHDLRSVLIVEERLKGGIKRLKEHAALIFKRAETDFEQLSFEEANKIDPETYKVTAEKVYSELVPFGASYHNIVDDVQLFKGGALTRVKAQDIVSIQGPLGSPFPLDAALHAACVWGQRYSGFVGFPVSFRSRHIIRPTVAGDTYFCRVNPVSINPGQAQFDIWIYGEGGVLFEAVFNVNMKDVTSGRMRPPLWISV